ncbi:MAG TPA: response regulator [Burkholderiaceae bacterium]|nr:response regulator [Burkholderiaceae bacterium]
MLDDDPDYLEMMAMVLPANWPLRLFLRPQDCIRQLLQEPPHWDTDATAQQQIVDRWRRDRTPLIPQILRYWEQETARYGQPQVCVVDYSMPAMNGLKTLQALGDWPGTRVLLTGQADEQIAVTAFNEGLIQQFVPKQISDMAHRLVDAVQRLQVIASGRTAQIWRATLNPRQYSLLRSPSVARDLANWVSQHWIEHVVIGDPFGILGRDADGRVGWLQLEPASGLEELAEMAEDSITGYQSLADIRQGLQLVDLELRDALGRNTPPVLNAAFAIGQDEPLLGAMFPVGNEYCDAASGFNRWLAAQPARAVQE